MPLATQNLDVFQLGKVFAQSGFFADARDESKAIVKILAGQELGISPFTAMTSIHVIQGKPSVSAGLMAQAVKASAKYDYRVLEHTEALCALEFYEHGQAVGVSRFDIKDAQRAGTQNLQKYARNMLFARAISNGVKFYCPDVFTSAVYTPEELGAIVDGDGNVKAQALSVDHAVATYPNPHAAIPDEPTPETTVTRFPPRPENELEVAIQNYEHFSQEGEKLGIKRRQLPADASLATVNAWVRSLSNKVEEKRGQQSVTPRQAVQPNATPLAQATRAARDAAAQPDSEAERVFAQPDTQPDTPAQPDTLQNGGESPPWDDADGDEIDDANGLGSTSNELAREQAVQEQSVIEAELVEIPEHVQHFIHDAAKAGLDASDLQSAPMLSAIAEALKSRTVPTTLADFGLTKIAQACVKISRGELTW